MDRDTKILIQKFIASSHKKKIQRQDQEGSLGERSPHESQDLSSVPSIHENARDSDLCLPSSTWR